MYCKSCGTAITERSKFCPNCGKPLRNNPSKLLILLTVSLFLCAGVFTALYLELTKAAPAAKEVQVKEKIQPKKTVKTEEVKKTATKQETPAEEKKAAIKPPKEPSQIIKDAQPKVFTIVSDYSQGSGFLINSQGDILTNAHVAEGSLNVTIRDYEGNEHSGKVIGYSNDTDIAVIRASSLAGRTPLGLEQEKPSKLGDEVIALGSPQGFENTATIGNISGIDRSFTIEPHTYDGIYQISAPIAPGSSGGPLLDMKTEKAVAINSARHDTEATIGFSIPLYKVMPIINGWVSSPMSEESISSLFYNDEGLYFYEDLYDDSEYYFDGGDYSDEYEDYSYEEYEEFPYEDYEWEDPYIEEPDADVPEHDYEEPITEEGSEIPAPDIADENSGSESEQQEESPEELPEQDLQLEEPALEVPEAETQTP
ncbi:trypsin-like peptidase domain-containing protein [Metabacillus sp. 84]|uniref:trypsin-like peptidase domain-containing protein n=1 Tax=Metabacillus sp. 84 TaxID=3404705 RepID=UPI003CE94B9E